MKPQTVSVKDPRFQDKNRLCRALIRTSPDIVYVLDINRGTVQYKNRSLWQDLGYDIADVERPDAVIPQQFLHPNDRLSSADLMRDLKKLGKEEVFQLTIRLMARSGTWRNIQVRLSILDRSITGKPRSCMGILTDITAATEGLRIMEEARRIADETVAAKTYVLSQLSHELRTPIGCIIGAASLLANSVTDDEQQQLIQDIIRCGNSLTELLSDVMEHGQLEQGLFQIQPKPVAIRSELAACFRSLQGPAVHKGLDYRFTIAKHIPELLYADMKALGKIATNLVSNAIKYTPNGRVAINIDGFLGGEKFILRCNVADTGIGISPELQPEIFQSFTRGQSDLHQSIGGVGLGLAITKAVIDKLDGHIWFQSEPGRGTEFQCEIPLRIYQADTSVTELPPEQTKDFSAGIPCRVLLVDDNPNGLPIYKKMIEKLGATCITAQSGKQAIAKCREYQPDFVFMDCQMPDIDGFSATNEIRKMPAMRDVPIVALTAHPPAYVHDQVKKAGMNGVLSKPVQLHDLEKALRKRVA